MTPIDFARNLAESDDFDEQVLGVAIIYRGLTDEDPNDPLRLPWPDTNATIERAAMFLNLEPTAALRKAVRKVAPTVSDAMLNRRPT